MGYRGERFSSSRRRTIRSKKINRIPLVVILREAAKEICPFETYQWER